MGDKTWFLRFISETRSNRREVFGGILLCAPRPIHSNGTWIIAIGHHSWKLGRQVSLFLCYANLSEFCRMLQARVFDMPSWNFVSAKSKVQLENLFGNCGAGIPKGHFCPLQNASTKKKVADDNVKLCKTYSTWLNKIFGEKIFDQGHTQVELLTKMFGRISRKRQSPYCRREAVADIDRSATRRSGRCCHPSLTDDDADYCS